MYDTAKQVSKFHNDKVNLASASRNEMKARRDTNRNRLKSGLDRDEKPAPIGLHTQGSYAMHTMVQDADCDYDIDDGVYFKEGDLKGPNGGEMSALDVRKMVCEALQSDNFKIAPKVKTNCVRVFYEAGYHVDVPSYRRIEKQNMLTGKTDYKYELASADWKDSDPKEVTRWFRRQNKSLSPVNDTDQFRRIVRLLKAFSRSRKSWIGTLPSGFALSKIATESFVYDVGRDDQALRSTMLAMLSRVQLNKEVDHPVVDEKLNETHDGKCQNLADHLEENLKHLEVLDDPGCTHDDAMKAWDTVFNTTWFSSQSPPKGGDDDDGNGPTPAFPVNKKGRGTFAFK